MNRFVHIGGKRNGKNDMEEVGAMKKEEYPVMELRTISRSTMALTDVTPITVRNLPTSMRERYTKTVSVERLTG